MCSCSANYIDAFKCTRAQNGHRAILALECFTVADHPGWFHQWYKWTDLDKQPPREKSAKWMDMTDPLQNDVRPHFASTLALMGSPKKLSYSHPKVLGWYFDHVYHQHWYVGQLTRKSWDKSTCHNKDVYDQGTE